MQKQAVPLVVPEAPYIGTGVEARAARDAGDVVMAEGDGVVTDVSGDQIVVEYKAGAKDRLGTVLGKKTYRLAKFLSLIHISMLVIAPIFSRDVYSYAAQGEMVSHHMNPYLYGPFQLGNNSYTAPVDPLWLSLIHI